MRTSVVTDISADVSIWTVRAEYPRQVRIWSDGDGDVLLLVKDTAVARELAHQLLRSAQLLDDEAALGAAAKESSSLTCDWCDKPMIGGAAGGGLPSQHWCAEHDPTLDPDYDYGDNEAAS